MIEYIDLASRCAYHYLQAKERSCWNPKRYYHFAMAGYYRLRMKSNKMGSKSDD